MNRLYFIPAFSLIYPSEQYFLIKIFFLYFPGAGVETGGSGPAGSGPPAICPPGSGPPAIGPPESGLPG
jgi:hypothetical protein